MNKFRLIGSILILLVVLGVGFMMVLKPRKLPPVLAHEDKIQPAQSSHPVGSDVNQPPPPPRSEYQRRAVEEVRHQLESVMALNKNINLVQSQRAAQLMRIQEQTLMHKKMIANFQKASGSYAPPTRESLLAQEKIRIIREETLRNKKLLEDSQEPSQKTT